MSFVDNQRVIVAVRVRPILSKGSSSHIQEKGELQAVFQTSDNTIKVELNRAGDISKSSTFTFDYIFDQESTQLEVYEDAVVDMVEGALVGNNATVLAYGQTGAGKTFTVLGDVKPNPLENEFLTKDSGLFLRVLSELLEFKNRQGKKGWHVVIGLSCIEVYCNSIRDLFGGKTGQEAPELKAKMINESVLLPNLTIKEMTSLQDVLNEIHLAISRRQTRMTELNAASSRSHCLFSIDIIQQANSAPEPSLDLLDKWTGSNAEDVAAQRRGGFPSGSPSSESPKNCSPANSPKLVRERWEIPFKGTVLRVPGQKEPLYCSKIVLVDLAGSERIVKSKVVGQGQKEATSINTSLTALGNVVHSLYEGGYANYRDSNLTVLLKPAFAHPTSRVLLLAQCSPTQLTFDETINTLRFANKVKALRVVTSNGPEVEKQLLDYIQQRKLHDAICSDLHIFTVEQFARLPLVRRKCTQNRKLYYGGTPGPGSNTKSKLTTSAECYAALEAIGAIAAAQKERVALLEKQQREAREKKAEMRKAIDKECDNLVSESKASIQEILASIQRESQSHRSYLEEQLMSKYYDQYKNEHCRLLKNRLAHFEKSLVTLSRELQVMKPSTELGKEPKVVEEDEKYALSVWAHCISKRVFSKLMEFYELQSILLEYRKGNFGIEKWIKVNEKALK